MIDRLCVACRRDHWMALGKVASQSLLSDGRIVDYPLARTACAHCGLARHVVPPTAAQVAGFYDDAYALYDNPIGGYFEDKRQQLYARWLTERLGAGAAKSLFEIGCGNGSLMYLLERLVPGLVVAGIEPAAGAVGHCRSAGLAVTQGGYDDIAADQLADMVIAINVIEHVGDPFAMLRRAAAVAGATGRVILVHPDGERPSSELLFVDHLHSFTKEAIRALARRVGLHLRHSEPAPEALGPFVGHVLTCQPGDWRDDWPFADDCTEERRTLLGNWAALDGRLTARLAEFEHVHCFGTGEAAAMLRCYAAAAWRRIEGFVVDAAPGEFDGRPVTLLSDLPPSHDTPILLAIREDAQGPVSDRLLALGYRAIRWDDLVRETEQA